ncbi:MAG: N-acetyl-gamma-glutamyl-phosphate reductase [Candidatus Bathyarchaeia archaeon]
MASSLTVGVIGATGYTGVALLEVLVRHPNVELAFATTRQGQLAGTYVNAFHPNLLGVTELKFTLYDPGNEALASSNEKLLEQARGMDVVFLCLPSGASLDVVRQLHGHRVRIIDASPDFRLKSPDAYRRYYGREHPLPELLKEFVYGLPELHREELKQARYAACPGCNATAMILAAYPLTKLEGLDGSKFFFDVMVGSSEAGAEPTRSSHHSERSGVTRPYSVKDHRHLAEVRQELRLAAANVTATMFSVDMVRGVECIGHVLPPRGVDEKELWRAYRAAYGNEPFIRLRAKRQPGPGSLPDAKYVRGSNYCDVGFFLDEERGSIGILSALDNMLKGDVGNAVQAMNLMFGLEETTRLKDLVPSYLLG